MKYLNKKATEVMREMCKNLTESKIIMNSSEFMAVNIEVCGYTDKIIGKSRIIAVSHTFIQNGDIMRDPEMVFIEVINNDEYMYIPISYEQSNLCLYQASVILEDGIKYIPSLQKEQVAFANQWMINIKNQQNI